MSQCNFTVTSTLHACSWLLASLLEGRARPLLQEEICSHYEGNRHRPGAEDSQPYRVTSVPMLCTSFISKSKTFPNGYIMFLTNKLCWPP